jgi:hypothetical protein
VPAGHRFRLLLAPGLYLLNVGTQAFYKFPYGCPPSRVHVTAKVTTHANVYGGCGIL